MNSLMFLALVSLVLFLFIYKQVLDLKKEIQTEKNNIKELEEKLVALIDKDYGFSEDRY
jgi:regulator of sirC expression with transglutaminase-like and TPR domain|tara:strand:- start:8 stop:184 length:177 start_codon:yes stop_codon:yes gene_type:complete